MSAACADAATDKAKPAIAINLIILLPSLNRPTASTSHSMRQPIFALARRENFRSTDATSFPLQPSRKLGFLAHALRVVCIARLGHGLPLTSHLDPCLRFTTAYSTAGSVLGTIALVAIVQRAYDVREPSDAAQRASLTKNSGTGGFVERWTVRLIEWFLAPSRANSDESR